jgi:uncharacterized membrane protein YvlD (DUF360 family)
MADRSLSPATKIAIKAVINIILVWLLHRFLIDYFFITGGIIGFIIIGSLLTLMNLFLRPILAIITLPFKLLFTLLTTIVVNAFFLWIIYEITLRMDPNVVTLTISGGITGWLVISLLLGAVNWAMKHAL